jgi:hypothetical protein
MVWKQNYYRKYLTACIAIFWETRSKNHVQIVEPTIFIIISATCHCSLFSPFIKYDLLPVLLDCTKRDSDGENMRSTRKRKENQLCKSSLI